MKNVILIGMPAVGKSTIGSAIARRLGMKYTNEEINDYITVVNKHLKKEKIKKLEQELRSEIDPIKKAEILKEIMEVKGVRS